MFVSALPDPTCNSEKSANGGNKQILLLLLLVIEKIQLSKTTTFLKTSISTIKAVQKALLRLLFLA